MNLHRVFTETLATLPPATRAKIEAFWRKQRVPEHDGRLVPVVLKKPNLGVGSLCANTDGVIFNFKSAVVDQAPEDILRICIAHELAHAYRAAELCMPLNDATAYGHSSRNCEEGAADKLTKEWGFDRARLLDWLAQNETALGL